jgi:thioredoxin:protein disulfide reductase
MRVILRGSGRKRRTPDALTGSVAALAVAALGTAVAAGLPIGAPKLLPPEQAFRFSARAVDPSTLEARFDVADGYYLYRDKLRFTIEPVGARDVELPQGTRKHDEFFGDVETYRGSVVVRLPLREPAQGRTLTVHADSQGCADAGVCYPPNPQQLKLVVPTSSAKPGGYVEANPRGWFK